jgi:hypothetical protein
VLERKRQSAVLAHYVPTTSQAFRGGLGYDLVHLFTVIQVEADGVVDRRPARSAASRRSWSLRIPFRRRGRGVQRLGTASSTNSSCAGAHSQHVPRRGLALRSRRSRRTLAQGLARRRPRSEQAPDGRDGGDFGSRCRTQIRLSHVAADALTKRAQAGEYLIAGEALPCLSTVTEHPRDGQRDGRWDDEAFPVAGSGQTVRAQMLAVELAPPGATDMALDQVAFRIVRQAPHLPMDSLVRVPVKQLPQPAPRTDVLSDGRHRGVASPPADLPGCNTLPPEQTDTDPLPRSRLKLSKRRLYVRAVRPWPLRCSLLSCRRHEPQTWHWRRFLSSS